MMSKNDIIIRGTCSNTPINILIDTGASVSLASTRLIDQLNLMHEITTTKILIAGLGKKVIPMRGEIKLLIELAKTKIWHTFVVCDNIENEILAGTDVMQKVRMQIDIPNKMIYTADGRENFLDKPISLSGKYKVKCNKTITIPTNSVGHLHPCSIHGKPAGFSSLGWRRGDCSIDLIDFHGKPGSKKTEIEFSVFLNATVSRGTVAMKSHVSDIIIINSLTIYTGCIYCYICILPSTHYPRF